MATSGPAALEVLQDNLVDTEDWSAAERIATYTANAAAGGAIAGQPTDPEHTSLELESSYLMRTGREPSNDEILEYLNKHRLQTLLTDIIMYVARHLPPDPLEFLLTHIEAMVMKHRAASDGKALLSTATSGTLRPRPAAPKVMTPEKQKQVTENVVTVLSHPDLTRASALKLFGQFSSGGDKITSEDFSKLLIHMEVKWSLEEEDSKLMGDVLKRWRFRTNAASGTRGLPLWPLSKDDFVRAYPSMIRSVRDRYVPIGGAVHRSLFIRRAAGSLSDRYNLGPVIGRGAFGEVQLVTLRDTGERRVCKTVGKQQQKVPEEEVNAEIDLLRALDHPHIIRVFEYFDSGTTIEMIMEPVFGGTLTHLVRGLYQSPDGELLKERPEALTEAWMAIVLAQLLGALVYAHDVVGVVHKDLKCDNVLLVGKPRLSALAMLNEPVHAMLADFGIAEVFSSSASMAGASASAAEEAERFGDSPGSLGATSATRLRRSTRVGGTPTYMSPEMFKGSFTAKSDIWSLGVMVFQMMTGELPYQGDNLLVQAQMVCSERRHPRWELLTQYRWSVGARWVCQQLLCKDEAMRPSAEEALKSEWLVKSRAAQEAQGLATDAPARTAMCKQQLQSHLMRMAMTAITSQLSLSQLHDLNLRFKHYDSSGDGRLNYVEAKQVLADVGVSSNDQVGLLLESIDTDSSGLIEYSEFIAGCLDLSMASIRQHLVTAFNIFDLDGSGKLSLEELRQVLTHGASTEPPADGEAAAAPAARPGSLKTILPDGKTVEEVMAALDSNKTGKVELAEFERYLLEEHRRVGADHAARAGLSGVTK